MGHAEVVQINYNPHVIACKEILEIFFSIHDPTTLNRQGADVGSQYSSIILFRTLDQKKITEQFINNLNLEKIWDTPIVTQIKPIKVFYRTEEYHQQYFNRNPEKPSCKLIIEPKLRKIYKICCSKLNKSGRLGLQ